MKLYAVRSTTGVRHWHADDEDHAREQHCDIFPDEPIEGVDVAAVLVDDVDSE